MARLALALGVALALLVAVDRAVPVLVDSEGSAERLESRRGEAFVGIAARHARALRRDARIRMLRVRDRWAELPAVKGPGELRVFVIGNSAGIFSILPEVIRDRLTSQYPAHSVTLVPLLIEDARVNAEQILVWAALAKGADVIVLTPNIKGLRKGGGGPEFRRLFGAKPPEDWVERSLDHTRAFLRDHWQLYRHRFAVREWFRDHLISVETRAEADMQRAFDEIADAAEQRDIEALLQAYSDHRLRSLVATPVVRNRLPAGSPVFAGVRSIAQDIEASGAVGIAVYMPINPLFRDRKALGGRTRLLLDDTYARELGARVLGIFGRHGVATVDAIDWLPPGAFVDLVHVNDRGSRVFSDRLAEIIAVEVGRRLPPGEPL